MFFLIVGLFSWEMYKSNFKITCISFLLKFQTKFCVFSPFRSPFFYAWISNLFYYI